MGLFGIGALLAVCLSLLPAVAIGMFFGRKIDSKISDKAVKNSVIALYIRYSLYGKKTVWDNVTCKVHILPEGNYGKVINNCRQ